MTSTLPAAPASIRSVLAAIGSRTEGRFTVENDSGSRLRIIGRSGSHFTRAARIVAHELTVPVEFDELDDLMSVNVEDYGGHPALKIPTLQIGDFPLFGTDNICRKLAELAGRADDPRVVLSHQVTSDLVRSAQELVWHAMAVQVQLVIGVRVAKLPAENPFFAKARLGMVGSLRWLNERLDRVLAALPAPRDFSVFEVTLYCLIEHIVFRPMVPLDEFSRLRDFVAAFSARESAQRTPFRLNPPRRTADVPTTLKRPAIDPCTVTPRTTSGYPEVFRSRVTPREKRALGDALGLTRFGVNLTTLSPGKESSMRHYHAREDEFVFVVEGEVVLRTDDGEQLLSAGMCAGFPAGTTNGHQLVNRSDRPARYIEIGNRDPEDAIGYSDVDLASSKNAEGAWIFTHRDGSPY